MSVRAGENRKGPIFFSSWTPLEEHDFALKLKLQVLVVASMLVVLLVLVGVVFVELVLLLLFVAVVVTVLVVVVVVVVVFVVVVVLLLVVLAVLLLQRPPSHTRVELPIYEYYATSHPLLEPTSTEIAGRRLGEAWREVGAREPCPGLCDAETLR